MTANHEHEALQGAAAADKADHRTETQRTDFYNTLKFRKHENFSN